MNFLAHAYLSFGHPEILAGNMVSDFVKGAYKFSFSPNIQKGISLHRMIDDFTDTHAATQKAKSVFRPHYRLYSGAIVDIIYDHFLANDTAIFSNESLHAFTGDVYTVLEKQSPSLPPRFVQVLYYMKMENWLYHYRTEEGIGRSLGGLVRRAAYISDSEPAKMLLRQHYDFLRSCYDEFFPAVKTFAKQEFDTLLGGQFSSIGS
jgi:acyl carrier protein phosphodiesterase